MPPQTLVSILHYRTIPPVIKQTREKKILPKYAFFLKKTFSIVMYSANLAMTKNQREFRQKWRSRKVKRDYCVRCHQFKFARILIKLCNALKWVICYSQLVIIHVKTSSFNGKIEKNVTDFTSNIQLIVALPNCFTWDVRWVVFLQLLPFCFGSRNV